ncbi:putative Type 1 galactoside alpha-(1,2)-fucosyltransferase [Dioscorea sansibarensis]
MDMKRIRRHPSPVQDPNPDPESDGLLRNAASEKRAAITGGGYPAGLRLAAVFAIAVLMLLPLLLLLSRAGLSLDRFVGVSVEKEGFGFVSDEGSEGGPPKSSNSSVDKLLGGLLIDGFDEASCLSRYQSAMFHKVSPYIPSPYLLKRLRRYEALHKRCGPGTELYNKIVYQLKSDQQFGSAECNYVVWISYSGLGNRILTLASAFLYALLTDRVLLVDRGGDLADLFCEPFPETSWLLPLDFPVKQFSSFEKESPESYGNMLKNNAFTNSGDVDPKVKMPPYIYLHLAHDYGDHDKLFFCDEDQLLLQKIPWLVLRSDNYFVPSLFLMPEYEEELHRLFPQRDTVFHHLGRYLFHPTNSVWGLVKRYYLAYMAKADKRVGIQIRVFELEPGPFQHVFDQLLACALKEKLLPDVTPEEPVDLTAYIRSKAILVTSLNSGYSEKLRNMYWENSTTNGEIISVYQPSHEEFQQTGKQRHNRQAWAEMYLLSLTDTLITSAWSTFGYVAQGLAGVRPWILFKPENRTIPDPACRRVMSMEPCFHAPPFYDCKEKRGVDTGALVPYVRHCEDMSWGLKLVDQDEW